MTMARMIKLFKLPAEPVTPGLRPMGRHDITGVSQTKEAEGFLQYRSSILRQPHRFHPCVTLCACASHRHV